MLNLNVLYHASNRGTHTTMKGVQSMADLDVAKL